MKKTEAVVPPFCLDEFMDNLAAAGIETVAARSVKSFGPGKGRTDWYRGTKHAIDYLPEVRVEAFVPDEHWPRVVEILRITANRGTAKNGSALIFGCEEFDLVPEGHSA